MEKMCQSDGAPLETEEMYGTEADGSRSEDYCKYCYQNGEFTNPDCTLDEMIVLTTDIMVKEFGFDYEDAKTQCEEGLPTLKRWKK